MKTSILKFTVTVAAAMFVAVSAGAQTVTSTTADTAAARQAAEVAREAAREAANAHSALTTTHFAYVTDRYDFQADRAPIGAGNICFFNSASGWAVPIDATPGAFDGPPACDDHGGLSNAHWSPGEAYVHPSGLEIRVVARSGALFDVTVQSRRLLLDGFESGDVLKWSSSVGAP